MAGFTTRSALRAQTRGDRPGAALAYREALRLEPENYTSRNTLQNLLKVMGDEQGAAEVEGRAAAPGAAQSPARAPRPAFPTGAALDSLIAGLRADILVDPHLSPKYSLLAHALQVKGDLDGAIAAHHEAIRRSPDRFVAYANLGALLRLTGDLDGAIAASREAIRLKPDFAHAHVDLGLALRGRGDRDAAVAAFRAALAIEPDLRWAHVELMALLRSEADLQKGVAWLDALIARQKGEPRFHLARAHYLAQLGEKARAAADRAEANRLRPDDPLLREEAIALSPDQDVSGY